MWTIRTFVAGCLLLTGTVVWGQNRNEFSLNQAVDYAMQHSTVVKNALLDIKIQQQSNREITAMAFPQLQTSLTMNDYLEIPTSLVPGEFTGGAPGTFFPIRFGTKYNVTGSMEMTQILFDGQIFVGLQARRAAMEFSNKQAEVTKEMIKVNVMKLYYQLLVGRKQMESLEANIDRFEKLLKDTREIFKNGFAEKLDVDKVSVQLNNLQTEKTKVASLLDAGNAALKFLMNMPQDDQLVLTDSISESELTGISFTDSVSYSKVKEYSLLETGYQLSKYNVRRYQFSSYPTVALFASYNRNAQRSEFDFLKSGDWFPASLLGLRLQIPMFNGFARQSRIEKARLELVKTENSLEQMRRNIDNNEFQARLRIRSAVSTVEAQRKNMQLAEQVYFVTKLKYEQGLGSQQEIYNAQTELKVAQNNYYAALYDAVIAGVDYRKATGNL
jgi:outer membrane protein TolC